MEKIVSLAKRRGFVFPNSEIYGGLASAYDYGPLGVELKNNIKKLWWKFFIQDREDMVGIDGNIISSPKVWEASGHIENFKDPMIECKNCHARYRADKGGKKLKIKLNKLIEGFDKNLKTGADIPTYRDSDVDLSGNCDFCGAKPNGENFTPPRSFSGMFRTHLGPVEENAEIVYLRPETAQNIFINYKNILNSTNKKIPFGIGQIGKAFRNEITTGQFIFRTFEFEQMEIEYFIPDPELTGFDWEKSFDEWKEKMNQFAEMIGLKKDEFENIEISKEERAFYSKRTIDTEYKYPFGQEELWGLAYRGNYDLSRHQDYSKEDLRYFDEKLEGKEKKYLPHVIEPSFGVDRALLAVLCSAYDDSEKERIVLKLPPVLAPYKIAVAPLLGNKPELIEKARSVFELLKKEWHCVWDDRGNIGKRYKSQDEIGTPYFVVIDFDSLEDDSVTIRDRDTMEQKRIKISDLEKYFENKFSF